MGVYRRFSGFKPQNELVQVNSFKCLKLRPIFNGNPQNQPRTFLQHSMEIPKTNPGHFFNIQWKSPKPTTDISSTFNGNPQNQPRTFLQHSMEIPKTNPGHF